MCMPTAFQLCVGNSFVWSVSQSTFPLLVLLEQVNSSCQSLTVCLSDNFDYYVFLYICYSVH